MRLQGLVAVITGASRGLGRAVAIRFAKEGARVVICSRDAPAVEEVALEIRRTGTDVLALRADVAVDRDVDRLVETTLKTFMRIDVLVNNAGILTPKALLHQVRITEWDLTIAANLRGPFLCMRAVLPQMLAQRQGSIINVSSGAGKREAPWWGPYAVSKFGIEGLSLLAAGETRASGVRVNAVNPGGTRTAMRAMAYPEENPMTLPAPEEMTGVFVYLASPASRKVTGKSIEAQRWLQIHPQWR
jgi:NAD(P)-dependent dehydrogenase (short-subunit alcohol dehydrogenase family)